MNLMCDKKLQFNKAEREGLTQQNGATSHWMKASGSQEKAKRTSDTLKKADESMI